MTKSWADLVLGLPCRRHLASASFGSYASCTYNTAVRDRQTSGNNQYQAGPLLIEASTKFPLDNLGHACRTSRADTESNGLFSYAEADPAELCLSGGILSTCGNSNLGTESAICPSSGCITRNQLHYLLIVAPCVRALPSRFRAIPFLSQALVLDRKNPSSYYGIKPNAECHPILPFPFPFDIH